MVMTNEIRRSLRDGDVRLLPKLEPSPPTGEAGHQSVNDGVDPAVIPNEESDFALPFPLHNVRRDVATAIKNVLKRLGEIVDTLHMSDAAFEKHCHKDRNVYQAFASGQDPATMKMVFPDIRPTREQVLDPDNILEC